MPMLNVAEMPPVIDVDEIIETEVCNRLIRLSCAKMVNSRSERGGAKLHRNLLILHLLRRARDEQKRFPMFASSPEWMEGPGLVESSMMMLHTNPAPAFDTFSPHYVGVNDEENEMSDVGYDNPDVDAAHLLDLSNNHELTHLDNSCNGLVKQEEEINFGYSTLRLAPLQYTFAGSEVYGADETMAQQHMYNDFGSLSDMYFSEEVIPTQSFSGQTKEKEGEVEEFAAHKSQEDYSFDCLTVPADAAMAPVSESVLNEGEVCSCTNGNEVKEDENSRNSSEDSAASLQHRKRKTSSLRLSSPCNVKKCCVEERQLTGLISVFNSGLSVVADQFLSRPTASVSSLQQAPKQINSFIHIPCNPLIC